MAKSLTQNQINALSTILRANRDKPEYGQGKSIYGGDEGYKQAGSGVFKTLMDILDQPKSAITTAIRYGADTDPNTSVMGGFASGLAGNVHTSTADIMKEHGITNPLITGLGGFLGDVALDPLTYVGVNRVKGMTAGEAELRGAAEAFKEGAEAGTEAFSQQRAADVARQLQEANPYKLELRVGLPGRKKVVGSVKDPEIFKGAKDFVKGPEGEGRLLARMFSTSAEKPYGMDELIRSAESEYTGRFNDRYMSHRELFNAVPEEQRMKAFWAYNKPDQFGHWKEETIATPETMGIKRPGVNLADYGINTIGDLVEKVRNSNMQMKRAEFEQGLHKNLIPQGYELKRDAKSGAVKSTAVKREWTELTAEEQNQILRDTETELRTVLENPDAIRKMPGLSRSKTQVGGEFINTQDLTHEQLQHIGAAPIADIGEATLDRLASTFRRQTRAAAFQDAIERFGMDATSAEGQAVLGHFQENQNPTGMRWRPVGGEHGTMTADIAKLKKNQNVYLPEPIIDMLNQMERAIKDPTTGSEFMRYVDKGMGHIKAAQTILQPGYFTRTSIGDFLQNFAAGVRNPQRYGQSVQVLHEIKRNQFGDLMKTLDDPTTPFDTLTRAVQDEKSKVRVMIGGEEKTSGELYDGFIKHGNMSGEIITERLPGFQSAGAGAAASDIRDKAIRASKRSGNALKDIEAWAADKNISRESTFRMAHYIDHLDKYVTEKLRDHAAKLHMNANDLSRVRERLGPDVVRQIEEKGGESAAKAVRKFNIDYGALTSFERNSVKKVIPFYSWFRRNTPLQFSMLASKPGFMTLYGKGTEAMQNILGAGDGENDWMLPQWIRESYPVRLAQGNVEGNWFNKVARFAAGAGPGEAVFAPLLSGITPVGDLETVLNPLKRGLETGNPWEGVRESAQAGFNMTAPFVKGPAELATGRSIFTGQEIGDWKGWVAQQLGGASRAAYAVSGQGEQAVAPTLSSFLVGPRFEKVGQQRQAGEFQRRKDLYDKHIEYLRNQVAKRKGLDKEKMTPARYAKATNTPEIKKLANYLTRAGRSVGSLTGKTPVGGI